MAHGVAVDSARLRFPARAAFSIASTTAGVEAETSNHHEGVAPTDIDCDPVTLSLFSIVEESVGSEMALEEAGLTEDVARGAATIVARVIEHGMPAAVFVGLVEEAVGCCDREFDFLRCKEWCARFPVLLEVDRTHELFFVLNGTFGPLLGATTAHEGEAGEEQESNYFH